MKLRYRIVRLRLQPGDTVVLRLSVTPTREHIEHLREDLQGAFPDNKVAVLGPDAELQIVERYLKEATK